MTRNQIVISKYWEQYKAMYQAKFNETPKSWFGYQKWLAENNMAHNFEPDDTEFTKLVMGVAI